MRVYTRRPVEDRFWEKVNMTDSCWPWTGAILSTGYGRFTIDGKGKQAHRVAYEMTCSPIPKGLDLDHLCRNRACVRPSHLEPVSRRENLLRGVSARGITRCPKGHPYDGANVYFVTNRHGNKVQRCRACSRASSKAYYRKKVA